jgi:hypothetical protein
MLPFDPGGNRRDCGLLWLASTVWALFIHVNSAATSPWFPNPTGLVGSAVKKVK